MSPFTDTLNQALVALLFAREAERPEYDVESPEGVHTDYAWADLGVDARIDQWYSRLPAGLAGNWDAFGAKAFPVVVGEIEREYYGRPLLDELVRGDALTWLDVVTLLEEGVERFWVPVGGTLIQPSVEIASTARFQASLIGRGPGRIVGRFQARVVHEQGKAVFIQLVVEEETS